MCLRKSKYIIMAFPWHGSLVFYRMVFSYYNFKISLRVEINVHQDDLRWYTQLCIDVIDDHLI
jgi:hypothetical protein